jgi:hypothetical protein
MMGRAFVVGVVIAAAEVVHGFLRVRYLNRHVGDRRARRVGVFTGSILFLSIAWLTVPWIGVTSRGQCLGIGAVWVAQMLALDLGFGRYVFRASWKRIAAEFDLRRGGLLGLGMLLLLCAPLLVAKLRGMI